MVDTIKQQYNITDDDLTNVVIAGVQTTQEVIEKEASLAYGVLVSNLFNTQKVPTGLSAPLLAGSLVDGYLISKLFEAGTPGKQAEKAIKNVAPPVKPLEAVTTN